MTVCCSIFARVSVKTDMASLEASAVALIPRTIVFSKCWISCCFVLVSLDSSDAFHQPSIKQMVAVIATSATVSAKPASPHTTSGKHAVLFARAVAVMF